MMKFGGFILILSLLMSVGAVVTAQETETCEDGFRLVVHAMGETCVPTQPERVFTLDMTLMELLLIADETPAAFSGTLLDAYTRMHPEFKPIFDEMRETGSDVGYPPNVEKILAVKPDLILVARDFFTEGLYPQLSEIAPTVIYEPAPGQWQERLIFAGQVLDLETTVDELLADYEVRLAELSDLIGENAPDTSVSLVRTFPGQIGLVLEGTAAAIILREAGLTRPESQAYDYEYVLQELNGRPEILISEEELQQADGDIVFVFGDAPSLMDNPLWQTLSAVKEGYAYETGYYWWGDSLLSAHDMLDDLFEYVARVEPLNLNPFEDGLPSKEVIAATPTAQP